MAGQSVYGRRSMHPQLLQIVEAFLLRVLVVVDPHGFHRTLDPVGEQRLETSIAADVLSLTGAMDDFFSKILEIWQNQG